MKRVQTLFTLILLSLVMNVMAQIDWPDVTNTNKPWTRWWWHGNAVDSSEIARHLKLFADAGIGGVEITSIYGVRGQEENSIPYLSEKYIDILDFSAKEARKLGLGVDIPPGSGWRCGGLGLPQELADARLVVEIDTVRSGESYQKEFEKTPKALFAFSGDHKVDLSIFLKDNQIDWSPQNGEWAVYFVTQKWTGAKVKRPAPGGEGFSFNPYSLESTNQMLQPLSRAFENVDQNNIRSIFHDSFEYTGDWTPDFFQEFEKRRGYDVRQYLPELMGNGNTEIIRRVKCDYRETISDLVLQNFILRLKEWSNERGWKLRNQSHGSPANLMDLYGAVDIPETEIFRFDRDPRVLKFASSAANVVGHNLVSSESFTWQDEHFTVTLDTMKRSADLLLTSGVNHIFFHGTTYSPQNAQWPGWVFYASSQINPQNPIWRDLPAFNQYITRCQSILQKSQPDNDVLVYWPVYDVWSDAQGLNQKFPIHHPQWITDNPAGAVAERLHKIGVSYDFISDAQLKLARVADGHIKLPGSEYKTIVVPASEFIPLETVQTLFNLAEHGATIIFEKNIPQKTPGLAARQTKEKMQSEMIASLKFDGNRTANVGDGRIILSAELEKSLHQQNIDGEALAQFSKLLWLRKKQDSGSVYFISNRSNQSIDQWIKFNTKFTSAALLDPMSGRIGSAQVDDNSVYMQLLPGQSMFVKMYDTAVSAEPYPYWNVGENIPLAGEWSVEFVEGGPTLPKVFSMRELKSWTHKGDPETERFSGTAHYVIQCDAPAGKGTYRLNLGRVAESAQIVLNGKEIATVFTPPFCADVNLIAENNTLEIYVTNLPANRIRDLDRRGVEWRIFHDINFVNLDYGPFDASNWPVRESGLIGPVMIAPLTSIEF